MREMSYWRILMIVTSFTRAALGAIPAVAFLCLASTATAQSCPEEPVVNHWSVTPMDVASVGFIAGEEWGAVFSTPEIPASHFPIEILRVGFGWGSAPLPPPCGSGLGTVEDSLRIYTGDINSPGPLQFEIGGPQMQDGCINEFDLSIIPNGPGFDRIIMSPPFMVTARLATNPNIFTGPGPIRDQAGCIPGKNVIVCTGGICNGFTDACVLGCLLMPCGNWKVNVIYRQLNCNATPFTTFCNGDGGDQMGCTDCACGNNTPVGTVGGCLNSNNTGAQILASGLPSASNDSLRIEASGVNPGSLAVLTSGDNALPNFGVCPPGSGITAITFDGLRCIGGNFKRHGNRPSDGNGDVGVTNNGWGGVNGPNGGLIAHGGFVAGQTKHYAIIYRELPDMVCLTGLNTSNGVSVTFQP